MRLIAVFALTLLFAAPDLARQELGSDEIGRFVTSAEEMAMEEGLTATRTALPPGGEEIARRHGFEPEAWTVMARRVWGAYEARHMAPALSPASEKVKLNGLTGAEHGELKTILTTARSDLAFIAAETEADRAAISPFMDRLDRLAE
ncbi:hypothetical protein [Indioceanicola profundi]|uniref:hypothetical protein n=1 Tax=Indioceanicola profundi TaxID=2220096 RepID=UPI000E6AA9A2|nr:hypothetical protein [Indioceanicola profundi]